MGGGDGTGRPQAGGPRMTIAIERAGSGPRVVLSGELSVRQARDLHAALCEVAPAETPVVVDDTGVTTVDTSAIQLLVAFARDRRQAQRALEVTDGALVRALRRLGMDGDLPAGAPNGARPPA